MSKTHPAKTAYEVTPTDGYVYLAVSPPDRAWFSTAEEARNLPGVVLVVQRCMRRGPQYGSEWTVWVAT